MTNYINTSEVIDNLALTEFDTESESLVEITNESLIIAVPAKRFTIKRFYLIGEMLYNNTISVQVFTGSVNYIAKLLLGSKEFPRYSDFIESEVSSTYDTSNFKFLNALPVDVLIESKHLSQTDCTIDITIGVE